MLKFFLHVSREEQKKRFFARIEDPTKNWKILPEDLKETQLWKDYQKAYANCLSQTSTKHAPWYVIPADDKKNARLLVSQIILDFFKDLKMKTPSLSPERKKELAGFRKMISER